jgi:hypothetical protein
MTQPPRIEHLDHKAGAAAPTRLRFYAAFALRTFYDLAILRRKPGPVRWP